MSYIRKIKKNNSVYLAEVESYRQDGKVKQRVIRYLGKEINGQAVKRISSDSIEIQSVKQFLDYHVLHSIAQELNIPMLLGREAKYILLLVYTQLLTRKPIYKIPEYLEHTALKELLGLEKIVDKGLYQALDNLDDLEFDMIEEAIFSRLSSQRKGKKAMVLDVTDTYFSGSAADWKARKGKDGKYDKLVQISLAVTKEEGFPILHKLYEGNIGNVKIFQDTLADIRLKKFDVIILDRGMISKESISDLQQLNQKVITGLRLHEKIKNEYISKIDREEIYQPKYKVTLKNTDVFVMDFDYMDGKILAIYNPELETTKRQNAMINKEKYDPNNAKFMGYSLIYHTTEFKIEDVVKTYFEKDIVEKAYRELKSTINLHPIRKYRMGRIRAHVKICYLAYAILACMQYKLKSRKISATYALEQLQSVYKVTLESKTEGLKWDKVVTLKNEQKKILDALNCSV